MDPRIGVVVGTFGDQAWAKRGQETIEATRFRAPWMEWIHVHGPHLAYARNKGADYLVLAHDVDFLVFLDADDTLSSNYLHAMRDAIEGPGIYRPSTLGVYPDGSEDDEPVMIPRTHMAAGNCIVVGAACPAALFRELGGFDASLNALEDWDLWIKMILAGMPVFDVPEAVYRVGISDNSRNSHTNTHRNSYIQIRRRYSNSRGRLDIR